MALLRQCLMEVRAAAAARAAAPGRATARALSMAPSHFARNGGRDVAQPGLGTAAGQVGGSAFSGSR